MADKPFGVKQLHVVGAAGTPVIESQTTLKIGGQQVAITTNTSVSGVVTATAFVGDGSGLTGVSGGSVANLTATTLDVTGICTAVVLLLISLQQMELVEDSVPDTM